MRETLLTMLDIMLSWVGLTRTCHYGEAVTRSQLLTLRVCTLRTYLVTLRKGTPHVNIQKDISDVLNKDAKTIHSDLLD